MTARSSYTDLEGIGGSRSSREPRSHAAGFAGKLLTHEGAICEDSWWEASSPYVAEITGTFLLTLTYLCNKVSGDPVWGVTSNAFMVMVATYAVGYLSGGTLNPSVTIALWLSKRYSFQRAAKTCAVQILGGALAALTFYRFGNAEMNLGPKPGFSWWEVMIVEVLYTCMICFVYLNCAASLGNNPVGDQNGFTGIAVGLCFVAGGYASMPVSGTVMNPAIAVGLQLADMFDKDHTMWGIIYLPYQLAGAFMAVSAYRVVRPHEMDVREQRTSHIANWEDKLSAKVMAEFIGTFFIVLTKALNHVGTPTGEAWSVAAAVASMMYALQGVCGPHFNPAVTISSAIVGMVQNHVHGAACIEHDSAGASHFPKYCSPRLAGLYIGAQVLAGLAASSVYAIVHHGAAIQVQPPDETAVGGMAAVVLGEVIFTCLICYIFLTTSIVESAGSKSKQNNIAGIAVGMCTAVGGWSIGKTSGSLLNPAIAIGFTGLNAVGGHFFRTWTGLYVAFEIAGALVAALLFCVTHAGSFMRDSEFAPEDSHPPPSIMIDD